MIDPTELARLKALAEAGLVEFRRLRQGKEPSAARPFRAYAVGFEPEVALALIAELEKLRAEVARLNPYEGNTAAPPEQPARFISGVRYYLGMLEDGDNWSHVLGHIEEFCVEFDAASKKRAGSR